RRDRLRSSFGHSGPGWPGAPGEGPDAGRCIGRALSPAGAPRVQSAYLGRTSRRPASETPQAMSDSPTPLREKLEPPVAGSRVLLHSCCAPCSGEVMEAMLESGIDYSIFFYNPNIHPRAE